MTQVNEELLTVENMMDLANILRGGQIFGSNASEISTVPTEGHNLRDVKDHEVDVEEITAAAQLSWHGQQIGEETVVYFRDLKDVEVISIIPSTKIIDNPGLHLTSEKYGSTMKVCYQVQHESPSVAIYKIRFVVYLDYCWSPLYTTCFNLFGPDSPSADAKIRNNFNIKNVVTFPESTGIHIMIFINKLSHPPAREVAC